MFGLICNIFFASVFIGQGLSFGKFYLFHIMLVMVLFFLMYRISKKESLFDPRIKTLWPIVFISAYSWVSLTWSSNFRIGIHESVHLSFGLFILVSACLKDFNWNYFNKKILLPVLGLNLLISLMESFFIFRYPISEFSELAHIFLKENAQLDATNYPTGLHWNPNNNAFFILFTFPIFLIFTQSLKLRLVFLTASSWVIYSSNSRFILLGWVMLLAILAFWFLFTWKKKTMVIVLISLLSLFIVFVLKNNNHYWGVFETAKSLFSIFPSILKARALNEEISFNLLSVDWSLHLRATAIDGLAKIIRENLIFGVGAGGLADKTHTQGGVIMNLKSPHFYYMEFLAKYGLISFSLFFYWQARLVWLSYRENKLIFLSMIFFIIFNPVLSSVSYFLPMWGLFGYCMMSVKSGLSQNHFSSEG